MTWGKIGDILSRKRIGYMKRRDQLSKSERIQWHAINDVLAYRAGNETGAHENRSLHFPKSLTPATRRRIARLLGACI